jgi:MurNAc alpha-1-phosphate uridylyltransferase
MNVAMILASGRGERLRPLTDSRPKALCIVKGRPLIEHHINNLAKSGFEKVVINHAYLGGQIRHYLGYGKRYGINIIYSPEPPGGLETGGGIVKALPLLGEQPFLVVNADIYTDFDFNQIKLQHVNPLHLVLINKNPKLNHHGDFSLINGHFLSNLNPEFTFAGIASYHPRIFSTCSPSRFSVTPLIRQFASQNKATASVHHGMWFDIGSTDRLQAANSS